MHLIWIWPAEKFKIERWVYFCSHSEYFEKHTQYCYYETGHVLDWYSSESAKLTEPIHPQNLESAFSTSKSGEPVLKSVNNIYKEANNMVNHGPLVYYNVMTSTLVCKSLIRIILMSNSSSTYRQKWQNSDIQIYLFHKAQIINKWYLQLILDDGSRLPHSAR